MMRKIIIFLIISLFIITVSCGEKTVDILSENEVIEDKKDTNKGADDKEQEITKKDDTYIFEKSDIEKIEENNIYSISWDEFKYARNEILARHGHIFVDKELKEYFNKKSWYKEEKEVKIEDLSDIEKYNYSFIEFFEIRDSNIGEEPDMNTDNIVKEFILEEVFTIDLNKDSINEKIKVEITEEGKYLLTINDKTYEGDYGIFSQNPIIVDLVEDDNYMEIIVLDDGPSNDYISYFHYFDGENIVYMGRMEGIFNEGIYVNENKEIISPTRSDILHTWFYKKPYILSENHILEEVPVETYKTNYKVFIKEDFSIFSEKDENSDILEIKNGQTAIMTETDNESWIKIETQDGTVGWMRIDGYSTILTNDSSEKRSATEILAGLCFAD